MSERMTAKMRQTVAERAKGYCEYCVCSDCFSPQPFSIDHIFPKVRGGKTVLENLALICQGCNNHKYDKVEGLDAESKEMTSLYHPRQQVWSEHFTWNDDYQKMIGLTATGRATIEALKLNLDRVVNSDLAPFSIGDIWQWFEHNFKAKLSRQIDSLLHQF
jgi:HNH endonuclease